MIDRVVQAMLDRFEAGWRPPLDESIPEWEETLRPGRDVGSGLFRRDC